MLEGIIIISLYQQTYNGVDPTMCSRIPDVKYNPTKLESSALYKLLYQLKQTYSYTLHGQLHCNNISYTLIIANFVKVITVNNCYAYSLVTEFESYFSERGGKTVHCIVLKPVLFVNIQL